MVHPPVYNFVGSILPWRMVLPWFRIRLPLPQSYPRLTLLGSGFSLLRLVSQSGPAATAGAARPQPGRTYRLLARWLLGLRTTILYFCTFLCDLLVNLQIPSAGRSRHLLTAFSGCFAWCLGCSLSRQHVLSDFHLACADRELLYMDRADNHYHHHESLLPPIVNVKDYPKVPQNAYTFQPLHPPQGSLASPASAKYAVGSRDKLQSAVSFNPN